MSQKIYSDVVIKGDLTINTANAGIDTDKFLVQDANGKIAFRTGSEMLVDLGASGGAFVPYTGATSNVNLGEYGLLTGNIQFDLTPTQPLSEGQLRWNDIDGTLEFMMKGGNVTQQIGQELPILVKHADNTGLTNGYVVYTVGSDGTNNTVRYAIATSDLTSSTTFGVMTEDAAGGAKAFCTTFGMVRGINTLALVEGSAVWLSPTVAGGLTTTKPIAPDHSVYIGVCVRSHATEGAIFVNISNGYELGELHDVLVPTPLNNDGLFFDSATNLWKNESIASALGYTPAPITGGTGYIQNQIASAQTANAWINGLFKVSGNNNGIIFDTSISEAAGLTYATAGSNIWSMYKTSDGTQDLFIRNITRASNDFKLDNASGAATFASSVTATLFIKSGGTSSQFLKADGSVDATSYQPSIGYTPANDANVVHLTGTETITGTKTFSASPLFDFGARYKTPTLGYQPISAFDTGWLFGVGAVAQSFLFSGATGYNYTFPNATGTIALTSNLSAYQPLLTNPITGTGTTNFLPKFTGTSALGNSLIYDSGTGIGIGTTNPLHKLQINASGANNILGLYNVSGVKMLDVNTASGSPTFKMYKTDGVTSGIFLDAENNSYFNGGNFLIGTTTDSGNKLRVNGTTLLEGNVNIGSGVAVNQNLRISKNITGSTTSYGTLTDCAIQSDVTTAAYYNRTIASTQATAFTVPTLIHNYATQGTFGAGSTVTNQYGFFAESSLVGATNNYGFRGNIPSSANNWNLYMSGTANNYLQGNTLLGTATDNGNKLRVNGNTEIIGNIVQSISDSRINGGDTVGRLIVSNSGTTTYFGLYGSTHATLPNVFSLVTNSAERINVNASGVVKVSNLSGAGIRMVTADASGNLSSQAIPGGGGGGSTPVKLVSQTLTQASWTLVSGYYTYSFSNANVTTTCDVSVTPQNASYLTAYNAQILPYVAVAAGVATFYAQFPPNADIVVDVVITQTT